jgi:hypothetical protein
LNIPKGYSFLYLNIPNEYSFLYLNIPNEYPLVIHLDNLLGLQPGSLARCQHCILKMGPARMHVVFLSLSPTPGPAAGPQHRRQRARQGRQLRRHRARSCCASASIKRLDLA